MNFAALLAATALAALSTASLAQAPTAVAGVGAGGDSTQAPRYGAWGYDLAGRGTGVKPGDDFFAYANGGAVERLQIPPDRARFGNFDVLSVLSDNRLHAILEDTAKRQSTPEERQVGAFYTAFMDQDRVEQRGAAPLKGDLDAVRAVRTKTDMAALMGRANKGFTSSVFGVDIDQDAKDPAHYAVELGQGGLGLPDRDYYLQPDFAEKKAKYQAYVAQMLALAGWADPEANARAVVEFESRIARASWTRAEQRNRDKTYNAMTLAQLAGAAPGFSWTTFLAAADLKGVRRVVVAERTAFPKIARVYAATPLPVLKAWQAFHVADNAAPYLPDAFVQARFEFRNKTLNGQPELQARWKRAARAIDGNLGEAVGKVYVQRYFAPESKAQMEQLVGNLTVAFRARIEKLDWMTPQTRAAALRKLSQFGVKIAYPTQWRDYSAYQVKGDDLYGNIQRGEAYEWAYQVDRLKKPVDRLEWGMTPQTVNAYYNPTMNEIVFPAAILQPPFFSPDADPAINYGGIGSVIGHEMTHGFDDQGRKSDGTGRLRSWWTPADAKKFEAQAARYGAQYEAFKIVPGAHINGQLTMGENIADLGGVLLALDAYHASLQGRPAPVIDGLTGDQRVFLGQAQVWRAKAREDDVRQRLVTDPHSPPEARVNGPVRNVDAWYAAFDVQPGDKLYVAPTDRVRIW